MFKIQRVNEYPFVFQSSYPLERPRLSQNRSIAQTRIAENSYDIYGECPVGPCKVGGNIHIDPPKKEPPQQPKQEPKEKPTPEPVTPPKGNCWWTNSCKPIPPNLEDL